MIIKSKKFTLRPCTRGDEKSLIKNINDKTVYYNTSTIPYPYKRKDFIEWFNRNQKLKKRKKKTVVHFSIDVGGKVIGGVGIDKIDGYKGEIGYWIGKDYRNMGIATEAVRIVTRYGFNKLKLIRIYAKIFSSNRSSVKVIKRNNYKFEGKLIKEFKKDKQFKDVLIFAKTK